MSIEENRRDFAAQADAAEAFVRYERDVFAGMPNDGVGRRFTRRTGTDHVTDVGNGVTFCFEFFQQFNRTDFARFVRIDAVARVFQHCQRVQRNIGTAPRVRRGREVVCIGFSVNFEDGNSDFFGNFGA